MWGPGRGSGSRGLSKVVVMRMDRTGGFAGSHGWAVGLNSRAGLGCWGGWCLKIRKPEVAWGFLTTGTKTSRHFPASMGKSCLRKLGSLLPSLPASGLSLEGWIWRGQSGSLLDTFDRKLGRKTPASVPGREDAGNTKSGVSAARWYLNMWEWVRCPVGGTGRARGSPVL